MGHFIPAKFFKTRVEKFYLFYDPWFSLVKKKFRGTEYGIGWLPLGGYVKISGMIDESMDAEQMSKTHEAWEFRAKPAWQRLIIMLGGVFVNFVLAVFIYSAVFFVWGETSLPIDEVNKHGVAVNDIGKQIGFESGDKLLSINGDEIEDFSSFRNGLIFEMPEYVLVIRNGKIVTIPITKQHIKTLISKNKNHLVPRSYFVVDSVLFNSGSYNILKKGDSLVGVNGEKLTYADEFRDVFATNINTPVLVQFYRNNFLTSDTVTPNSNGLIGTGLVNRIAAKPKHESFGLIECLTFGFIHSYKVGLKYF